MPKRTTDTEHHEVITVKTEVKELPVKLQEHELLDRAAHLADCHAQLAEHDEHSKNVRKELAKGRSAIELRRAILSGVVKNKEELRDIRVAHQTDLTARVFREVREDTGEIISERPLRPEEMQRKLGLVIPLGAQVEHGEIEKPK
ncbi:MAG: hypothetical protein Q8L48_16820 [Archangium sp.]|nr:hypothetical protein [Archangium sp.]